MSTLSAKRDTAKKGITEPRSKLHEAIGKYNESLSENNKALGATAPVSNVLRDLGMEKERVTRFRNRQAQETPDAFIGDREMAFEDMETQIENSYFNAYSQYISSGSSEDQAKSKAMVVARSTQSALKEAIESEFGTDAKIISQARKTISATKNGVTEFK
jgi:hypothetical protein